MSSLSSSDQSWLELQRDMASPGLDIRSDLGDGSATSTLTSSTTNAQKHPRTFCDDLHIVSLNIIRGGKGDYELNRKTRDFSKFETLARNMTEHKIDIYFLQETWLTTDFTTTIAGVTLIQHGPDTASCSRLRCW